MRELQNSFPNNSTTMPYSLSTGSLDGSSIVREASRERKDQLPLRKFVRRYQREPQFLDIEIQCLFRILHTKHALLKRGIFNIHLVFLSSCCNLQNLFFLRRQRKSKKGNAQTSPPPPLSERRLVREIVKKFSIFFNKFNLLL